MSNPKYTVKRSRMHIRKVGTTLFRDVNVIDSASYSFDEQTIEKQSTNEVRGVVASQVVSTTGTLSVTFGDTSFDNFTVVTRSKQSTVGAVSNGSFTFPACEKGASFKLPHSNITAVDVPGLVENVDYQVFKSSGIVTALKDVLADVAGGTYSSGVTKRAAITAAADVEYEVIFTDELNGEVTGFYKWKPSLPQNVQLISPNEFGTYEVSGKILLDESKPADGDMGQFGYKDEVQAA